MKKYLTLLGLLGLLSACAPSSLELNNATKFHYEAYGYISSGIFECDMQSVPYYFDAKDRYTRITAWGSGERDLYFVSLETKTLGPAIPITYWGGKRNIYLNCHELAIGDHFLWYTIMKDGVLHVNK